jgi:ATPase family protein associated with various cellular activities (AAA)
MVTRREQESREAAIKKPTHKDELAEELKNMSVSREGNKITIPLDLPYEAAIAALKKKIQEEEEFIDLNFSFEHTVPEGSLMLFDTLQALYGFIDQMGTPGFFGSSPPNIINVQTSKDTTKAIPWGRFGVPGIDGHFEMGMDWRLMVPYFSLKVHIRGKHKAEIHHIIAQMKARTDSIYRGNAVRLQFPNPNEATSIEDFFPKFMDLPNVTEDDLIFSKDIADVVDVTLFTPIRQTQFCRDESIPLKRGILLEGPYGVGKTLTANVTATLSRENGWTFIYMKDVMKLTQAYAFALHHQPAIIFCEDIDEALSLGVDEDDSDGIKARNVNSVSIALDGIESKGAEVITVFTTNNVEHIAQVILRPGRIDTVVPVRPPDALAVQRLIRLFAKDKLPQSEDLTRAGELLAGKNAAVVREVVERSKLGAVRRIKTRGQTLTISARDIEVSALGMEAHNRLLEPKLEDTRSDIEKAADVLGHHLLAMTNGRPSKSSNGAPGYVLDHPEGGATKTLTATPES